MTDQVTATETVATETTTQVEKPSASVQTFDGQPFDADRAKALIEKLRGENKELTKAEKRLKELEAAEAKRQEAELSEAQKLQKQLESTQAELDTLKISALKRQAADKVGLPQALADRLIGKTPEELEIDAKALLETLPKQTKAGVTLSPTNPGGNAQAGETDAEKRKRLGIG